jgi:hypothetical protein
MKVCETLLVNVTPTPSDLLHSHQIRNSKIHVHFLQDLTKPKALFNVLIFLVRSC